jgi:hypothetical protein
MFVALFAEDWALSLRVLQAVLPRYFGPEVSPAVHANKLPEYPAANATTLEWLAKKDHLDLRLYQLARRRLATQARCLGLV